MSRWRVRKVPSSNAKQGKDGEGEHKTRYFCSAARGHVEVWVAAMVMVQVLRKGSVLEALIRMSADVE